MLNNQERPIVFFDLETTGVDIENDRIVELALVKIDTSGKETIYETRINPLIPIPDEVSDIHGIYDEDVQDSPTFEEVSENIENFIEGCDLAGYNIRKFDIPLLQNEFDRCETDIDLYEVYQIDIMKICHKMEQRNLSWALNYYCGESHDNAHAALDDVKATMKIFSAQLSKYSDLPETVEELDEFCDDRDPNWFDADGKFIWKQGKLYFNFGKYNGQSLEDIIENDSGYIRWIIKAEFSDEVKNLLSDALDGVYPEQEES